MAPTETALNELLEANKAWSTIFNKNHPGFLQNLAERPQRPKFLWIGCADSRVPETLITAGLPGEHFVHRNIANQIPPQDVNSNSVLAYAVGPLEVRNIVVVGHTRCGGIIAAYDEVHKNDDDEADKLRRLAYDENIVERCPGNDYIREWIQPIVKLVPKDPAAQENYDEAIKELTRANVRSQISNIRNCGLLPEGVSVYGLIYELETGLLHEV